MPISYLTRIVEFSATHYIRRADWPDERNAQEFGRAAVDHGHRYQCRITVRGPLVAEAGGVMSLETLDRLLADEFGFVGGPKKAEYLASFKSRPANSVASALSADI